MTVNGVSRPELKAAIIGGGPGGLTAAIALEKLGFVSWTLYEKKPQISETGGGITLQRHTWRMLEYFGVASNINANDFFRPLDGQTGQQRNARSGVLLSLQHHQEDTPPHQASCRMVRAKLQSAILKNVNQSRIQVSKKLVRIEKLSSGKLRIVFEDGHSDDVDLLIGADGIRSFVRTFSFPDHKLSYNGQSAYRTLIRTSDVQDINGIPMAPVFWQNVNGRYVFTCPLGRDVFEVTARIRRPPEGQDHVSWGQPFDLHKLLAEYHDFCPPLQAVLQLAAKGETQEFALFSGPPLDTTIAHGSVALIGDASHPLSGAFGAGAGFGMEDVYALSMALDWTWRQGQPAELAAALRLYDSIRSPHYRDLYAVLDNMATINKALVKEELPVDEEIAERAKRTASSRNSFMYYYKVDEAVENAIEEVKGLDLK